jgi:hypothetical protein
MQSSVRSVSRFLSIISLALACASCDGDEATCGPGDAGDELSIDAEGVELVYGALEYGQNNDCPEPDAPAGVISLTIAGEEVGGGVGRFTLCIGRPDLLATQELLLGPDDAGVGVRVVDVTGDIDGCTYSFDDSVPPTGSATAPGLCGAGADLSGFALVIDGTVTLERDCGGVIDSIEVAISSRVAVLPQP